MTTIQNGGSCLSNDHGGTDRSLSHTGSLTVEVKYHKLEAALERQKFVFNLAGLLEGTSESGKESFGKGTESLVGLRISECWFSTLIYFKPSVKLARFLKSFTSKD